MKISRYELYVDTYSGRPTSLIYISGLPEARKIVGTQQDSFQSYCCEMKFLGNKEFPKTAQLVTDEQLRFIVQRWGDPHVTFARFVHFLSQFHDFPNKILERLKKAGSL